MLVFITFFESMCFSMYFLIFYVFLMYSYVFSYLFISKSIQINKINQKIKIGADEAPWAPPWSPPTLIRFLKCEIPF